MKPEKNGDGKDYDYWTLMDSVLFCYTVITTIGYGNVAPRTFNGRIFVILYGLVGVPFTMLAIANLGKFLATVLKSWTRPFVKCARRFRRRLCKPKYTAKEKQRLMERESRKSVKPKSADDDGSSDTDDEQEEDEDSTSDGIVLFISFVIYIIIGSIAIAAYEPNMGVFEAIYFNFVTLTTIGLGDLVPQSDTYLVITLVYCTVGLALTTIAIEIAADTLKKLHYFGRKMENVANVQVWISMKALVKNLGDQFNVPIDEIDTLNLEQFVDNAIKVQEGELATLRAASRARLCWSRSYKHCHQFREERDYTIEYEFRAFGQH
ncbi:Ion channel [Teladorsagia circumcincta]|uniref:Ion channel n=2 Tax=Teladorsagia circumcincta TaxID=45464 RepID=A0A2G9U7F7_TELCI|nr:Ion channel [Teladorsagia circumcincta]